MVTRFNHPWIKQIAFCTMMLDIFRKSETGMTMNCFDSTTFCALVLLNDAVLFIPSQTLTN